MIRMIMAGCSLWVVGATASAQGSFDFDDISGLAEDPIIEINVNSIAIAFARNLLTQADPDTAALLEGLRGIKLRVYHAASSARQVNNFIADVTEELEDAGWQSVMSVQNPDSNVRIHMQMTETAVTGLTLMLFDGTEAVFLNIDGSVSASDLGAVMAAFNQGSVLSALPAIGMPAPVTTPVPAPAPAD